MTDALKRHLNITTAHTRSAISYLTTKLLAKRDILLDLKELTGTNLKTESEADFGFTFKFPIFTISTFSKFKSPAVQKFVQNQLREYNSLLSEMYSLQGQLQSNKEVIELITSEENKLKEFEYWGIIVAVPKTK